VAALLPQHAPSVFITHSSAAKTTSEPLHPQIILDHKAAAHKACGPLGTCCTESFIPSFAHGKKGTHAVSAGCHRVKSHWSGHIHVVVSCQLNYSFILSSMRHHAVPLPCCLTGAAAQQQAHLWLPRHPLSFPPQHSPSISSSGRPGCTPGSTRLQSDSLANKKTPGVSLWLVGCSALPSQLLLFVTVQQPVVQLYSCNCSTVTKTTQTLGHSCYT
jgi:hypothetical protein